VRCGEPEIGASDSAAEMRDGAAQEREKRGFGGGGERRLLRVYVRRRAALGLGCHPGRVSAPPWAVRGLSRAWARLPSRPRARQDSLVLFFLFFFSIFGFGFGFFFAI